MSVRDAIAGALSTADGVRGYTTRPAAPREGDAWPLLRMLDDPQGQAYAWTWHVILLLPQDEVLAGEWLIEHAADVIEALTPVGFVQRVVTVKYGVADSEWFGAQFEIITEG